MKCQQNLASVKLTRIRNGVVEEHHLCQPCAAAQSPYQKKSLPQLDEILSGILGVAAAGEAAATMAPVEPTCTTCGLPYSSYRQTLILGCSDCYESFDKLLVNELRRFHGAIKHVGRSPHGHIEDVPRERNVDELKARLADAVKAEDFALAAKLRDQLKELTAKSSGETSGS